MGWIFSLSSRTICLTHSSFDRHCCLSSEISYFLLCCTPTPDGSRLSCLFPIALCSCLFFSPRAVGRKILMCPSFWSELSQGSGTSFSLLPLCKGTVRSHKSLIFIPRDEDIGHWLDFLLNKLSLSAVVTKPGSIPKFPLPLSWNRQSVIFLSFFLYFIFPSSHTISVTLSHLGNKRIKMKVAMRSIGPRGRWNNKFCRHFEINQWLNITFRLIPRIEEIEQTNQ